MIERVLFIGSKHLGIRSLTTMYELAPEVLQCVVTIDDRSDTRCKLESFEEFALRSELRLEVLSKPSRLAKVIDEVQPEICIVAGWYWLLNKGILASVPKGVLGLHPSLLPKYRGGSPLVWAMINGDHETGVSLFYFDEGMDTGDVVAQRHFPIEDSDTIANVLSHAEDASMELLQAAYPDLISETAQRTAQDHSAAMYCAIRSPDDGRINWQETNAMVCNKIRAQTHPYPGAFCSTSEGERLYLWEASLYPFEYFGSPGQVVQILQDGVVVTCGYGAVVLKRVQVDSGVEAEAIGILRFGQRLH